MKRPPLRQPSLIISVISVAVPLALSGCATGGHGPAAPVSNTGVPMIGADSTRPQIAAYVAYYQAHGYTITTDRRQFTPAGAVAFFQFAAQLDAGTTHKTVRADINAASHTAITSSSAAAGTFPAGRPRTGSTDDGR